MSSHLAGIYPPVIPCLPHSLLLLGSPLVRKGPRRSHIILWTNWENWTGSRQGSSDIGQAKLLSNLRKLTAPVTTDLQQAANPLTTRPLKQLSQSGGVSRTLTFTRKQGKNGRKRQWMVRKRRSQKPESRDQDQPMPRSMPSMYSIMILQSSKFKVRNTCEASFCPVTPGSKEAKRGLREKEKQVRGNHSSGTAHLVVSFVNDSPHLPNPK